MLTLSRCFLKANESNANFVFKMASQHRPRGPPRFRRFNNERRDNSVTQTVQDSISDNHSSNERSHHNPGRSNRRHNNSNRRGGISSSQQGNKFYNQQNPSQHTPRPSPEDPLKQYTFNEISNEMIRTLDIHSQVMEDLLLPGKGVGYLHQIITVAGNQFNNAAGIKFETKNVSGFWVGTMTINFPDTKTFTCKHKNKKDCKNLCSLAAIYHLRKNNSVDSSLRVNIDTSITNNFIDNSRGPVRVSPIPMGIKQQMMSFVSKFDEYIANLIDYRIENAQNKYRNIELSISEGKHSAILEGLDPDEGLTNSNSNNKTEETPNCQSPLDLFTNKVYRVPDSRKRIQGFAYLKNVFDKRQKHYRINDQFYEMIEAQEKLPIRSMKDAVIDALENNRAIVVAGETGSGKSTQVPQFILEHLISSDSNCSSYANIAITQPRRISAISLAERVASELGEPSAGYTVGHNVRFDCKLPERDLNVMTFFTTGMLLRKLQNNPDLKGVTHLIVDEVHERDCTTDFLLILIKRLLNRRKDLKVVFMSASMDATLFSNYFDRCPIVSVSGRCYPVKDYYLPEICREIGINQPRDEYIDRAPKLNSNLLSELIVYIDETRDQGAILCFMPGWKEMTAMQKELEICRSRNKLKVLLVHSKLPISEQRLIFSPTKPNERKVILATNIAETSITINDVRYVIDTGLCNSIDYDPELNISTFGTRWISRANAKQRSGRAGRTCPGECFKLYTKGEETSFRDFPFPELLRIPLESVIMEVKSHCPDEKAVTFLSQAIQHPSISAIHNALEELTLLGILDTRENLTILGRRISDFPTHPRLSVSLVVSAALRCLYPVLNTSAILSSTQEPFLSSLTDKSQIRETKRRLCTETIDSNREPINFMSDHLAFGNLIAQYDNATMSKHEHDYFIEENNLNKTAMLTVKECRNLYARLMISSRFVNTYDWYSLDSIVNRNINELEFIIAALTYSFYPKIVRIIKGVIKGGRMYPNKMTPIDSASHTGVRFASDSLVRNISLGKQTNSLNRDEWVDSDDETDCAINDDVPEQKRPMFLTYLNSRVDQESGQIVINDGSVVPPLTLLLFGGRELYIQESNPKSADQSDYNTVNVNLDRHKLLSFKLERDDATVVQEWRRIWSQYFNWFVHTKNTLDSVDPNDSIIFGTMNDFLELNKKIYASIR